MSFQWKLTFDTLLSDQQKRKCQDERFTLNIHAKRELNLKYELKTRPVIRWRLWRFKRVRIQMRIFSIEGCVISRERKSIILCEWAFVRLQSFFFSFIDFVCIIKGSGYAYWAHFFPCFTFVILFDLHSSFSALWWITTDFSFNSFHETMTISVRELFCAFRLECISRRVNEWMRIASTAKLVKLLLTCYITHVLYFHCICITLALEHKSGEMIHDQWLIEHMWGWLLYGEIDWTLLKSFNRIHVFESCNCYDRQLYRLLYTFEWNPFMYQMIRLRILPTNTHTHTSTNKVDYIEWHWRKFQAKH